MKEKQVIGTVFLRAATLDVMARFYEDIIGMQIKDHSEEAVTLGTATADLLTIIKAPQAQRAPNSTGLYHFAILVPSLYDLARSLRRLAETQTRLQGMSDHAVSEAIYLADPEGNGIEIYRDRPRDAWYEDNEFQLTTIPMDVDGVLSTLNTEDIAWIGLHDDTIIGHIHLHVSNIPETEEFYRDLLGLDVMMNIGSATFMSYDGYHHHIGANIWAGRTPPPPNTLGLDHFVLDVGSLARLQTIRTRLEEARVVVDQDNGFYWVTDPSANRIAITAGD